MDLTINEVLKKGIEAHKSGKVQEADKFYTAILKAQPQHPDANHNMGVLAVGIGKVEEALPFFKKALEANDTIAQFWLSYINALAQLNKTEEAQEIFDQAKQKGMQGEAFDQMETRLTSSGSSTANSPLQDPPQNQLTSLIHLYSQGQLQEALVQVNQLLEQFPNSATLYNMRGSINSGLQQFDSAIINHNVELAPHKMKSFIPHPNQMQGQFQNLLQLPKLGV